MSHRHPRALLPALVLAVGAAALTATPTAPAAAAGRDRLHTVQTVQTAQAVQAVQAVPGEPVELDEPVRGRAAVRALGDDLERAARLNDQAPGELRQLLLEDPTAWLDTEARLFFKDAAPVASPARATTVAAAPFPLDQTFLLHSKPGSQRTIHLDFDGHTVSGTQWNDAKGVATTAQPAWDPAGNGPGFTDAEKRLVQNIWERVAEDYAPFDVDVTTQLTSEAQITRNGSGDQVYGTRVLFTPSTAAHDAICVTEDPDDEDGCAGIAYLDVFDTPTQHARFQPAWVFTHQLYNNPKYLAEAASHEAGHNLGLDHDGRTVDGQGKPEEYYGGHGFWAPIMGAGYGAPLVQWSQGSYADASNPQDDLAQITSAGLSERADEAGGTVATAAAALPDGAAFIGSPTDVDVFALGTCSGAVSVAGLNAATSPNLDLQLRLLDAAGTPVATAGPSSAAGSPWWDAASWSDVTTGTDATVSANLATGSYFVEVDGVGNGSWTGQYDDYGSLGAYTLAQTGSCGAAEPEPGTAAAPQGLSATADVTEPSVTLTWSAPLDDGGSTITGYRLTRAGADAVDLAADATSYTVTGLAPGTSYTFTLRALNGVGEGATASASATTAAAEVVVEPSAPRSVQATWSASDKEVLLLWDAPLEDGGAPIVMYDVYLDGSYLGSTDDGDARGVSITDVPPGTHELAVAACNSSWQSVGCSVLATASVTVPTAPTAPTSAVKTPGAPRVGAPFSGKKGRPLTAGVRWTPPTTTGGAPVTGYVVVATKLTKKGRVVRRLTSEILPASWRSAEFMLAAGRYRFAVRARNSKGLGPWSAFSRVVKAR